jgi:hypothetical protein
MLTAASAKSISRSRRSSRLSTSRPGNSKPQVLISRESVSNDHYYRLCNIL